MKLVLRYINLIVNNVVIVSDAQWRNSARHIHVSILPQIPLPFSLCYMLCFIVNFKM